MPESGNPSDVRPDLVAAGAGRLGFWERHIIAFVRGTFDPGRVDRIIRFFQHWVGSTWIHHFTKNLRFVFGLERLPRLARDQSYVLVSNHRSFFDLYVVIGHLVRLRLK